jgi:tetratricopeptide (TPR) repeat protein
MAMEQDDFGLAKERLPKVENVSKENLMPFDAIGLAYKMYVDSRIMEAKKERELAQRGHAKMAALLTEIKAKQAMVSQTPEYADYVRELQTLGVLHKALTGDVTQQNGMIHVWYQAAIDVIPPESRLMPPAILYPMEYKLGVIEEREGRKEEALQSYQEALLRQPSYSKAKEAIERLQAE